MGDFLRADSVISFCISEAGLSFRNEVWFFFQGQAHVSDAGVSPYRRWLAVNGRRSASN